MVRAAVVRFRPRALLLGLLLAMVSAFADPLFPALTGRVVDDASLLSPAQEQGLTALLEAYEKKTTNQVVVVTLPSLEGYEIADYGYRLGRHWGIGRKGKDNGVLLIVAPNERAVRIEVGYGLEGNLTDKVSHDIIQGVILPRFKRGDVPGGIRSGAEAILGALDGGTPPAAAPGNSERPLAQDNSGPINFGFFVIMVLGTAVAGQSQKVRFSLASVTAASVAAILLFLDEALFFALLLAIIAFMIIAFGGSRSGHRGGGSGGSWGGGFSGGGGSFGGGGASGRW